MARGVIMGRTGRATAHVDAPPDRVFAVITDLPNLPAWNERMTGVVELPDELSEGAEWVVAFSILGSRFTSRSRVLELDDETRRFVHRSQREDGNPSYTVWRWAVDAEGEGSRVTLEWELRPETFLRKCLAAPIRGRQIGRHDADASLAALAALARTR
jgi:uncharacterized membrane protein